MIYDITQELFSCHVFPGDPAPAYEALGDMQRGDLYNLTAFSMCAHNGTHLDAPAHFIKDGKTIDAIDPSVFFGPCAVLRHEGDVTDSDARRMLERAESRLRKLKLTRLSNRSSSSASTPPNAVPSRMPRRPSVGNWPFSM